MSAQPMETGGAVASYEPATGALDWTAKVEFKRAARGKAWD